MHRGIMSGTVKILYSNENAGAIISAAGRISTTKGTADEIYAKSYSNDAEVNNSLIEKILLSGHRSVLEHVYFNLSFDNVSVFVEQFMIEFRLASFTVKSRRYVDFSGMGFYEPTFSEDEEKNGKIKEIYKNHVKFLFDEYAEFLSKGVPKEDARFVLPYCFKSNFYCSVNARELVYIIKEMIFGRGSKYPEIKNLGEMLKAQCGLDFPYLSKEFAADVLKSDGREEISEFIKKDGDLFLKEENKESVSVINSPSEPDKIVCMAYALNNDIKGLDIENEKCREIVIKNILKQSRKRELEQVGFTVKFNRISLAGLTHLARHRMQSLIVPEFSKVCDFSKYIVPESVVSCGLEERYRLVFEKSLKVYNELAKLGMLTRDWVYLYLSGLTIPVMTTMNANELYIFFKLRTCNRAQWEIKEYADDLLWKLRKQGSVLFSKLGPSCYVSGKCPEGRMSCMKMKEMTEKYGL